MFGQARTLTQILLLCIAMLGLTGCQLLAPAEQEGLNGRIMIWHSWSEEGHQALSELIQRYNSVHPDVAIVLVDIPQAELKSRYENTAALGLGPDLLIGSSEWLDDFLGEELLADLSNPDLAQVSQTSRDLVTRDDTVYAIPLSLQAPVLYYNRNLISENIPQTYSELKATADRGQVVAINIGADNAFSGIQAFGEGFIEAVETDEAVQGQVLRINPEGFLLWLEWLQDAQENPNFILSQDAEALANLFDQGNVAYYLGGYDYLARHTADDPAESPLNFIGISPLPRGDAGLSRPLIQAEVLYFNHASSERQMALAADFASFITNEAQGSFLLRELDLVPANQRVRVGRPVYPTAYPFTQSARTAVSIPRELKTALTGSTADAVYTAILSDVQEPTAAFCDWQADLATVWDGLILSNNICTQETEEASNE